MQTAKLLELTDVGDGLSTGKIGRVQLIVIDKPKTRNAISRILAEQMAKVLDDSANDKNVGSVVIAGTPGIFSSGGDFGDMQQRTLSDWREHFDHMARLTRRLVSFNKPTVAAVSGAAIGGGMALACCCDKVVASEDMRLVYGFDRLAVLPDVGFSYTLAGRIGAQRARRLMLFGGSFSAREALEEGLVDLVTRSDRVLDTALAAAADVACAAPLPIGYIKSFTTLGLERALAFERDCASVLFTSQDHAEGMDAFKERRAALFEGK